MSKFVLKLEITPEALKSVLDLIVLQDIKAIVSNVLYYNYFALP